MIKPYDFVLFLKYVPYNFNDGNCEYKEGKIPIKIKTLTPIHISSGEYAVNSSNSTIYKEFAKINNIPVIPATSFKGCIRNIAESISYSSLFIVEKEIKHLIPKFKFSNQENCDMDKQTNIKETGGKKKEDNIKCIICNMFGRPGQKSKITFNDLKGIRYKLEIRGIPESFKPNPGDDFYFENGNYKGYKFYKHGINGIQPKGKILYEFVLENSQFEGEIIYRNLTEEQMQLLCFSLGLSGDINPKIGYGKNYFYGSIEVTSDDKWTEKAKQYKSNAKGDIKNNIDSLISILSYKNAVSSLD